MLSAPRYATRWLLNLVFGFLQRVLLAILACGPLPKHIAFVMDGNRRYARRQGKQSHEGHYDGFSALHRMLEVCLQLRIHCVSVYAFAIPNFNRPAGEVEALMNLCERKLYELCEQGELLEKYGVRLQVLGQTGLLPQHVKDAVKKAEATTRHHDRAILNVLMPYTARDEITSAVQSTVRRALDHEIDIEDITEDEIDSQLYTSLTDSPPLDILVRTSGVKRFSDFLLWQCCENTQVHFTPTYWPDFGLWDFAPILLDYQRKIWSRGLVF